MRIAPLAEPRCGRDEVRPDAVGVDRVAAGRHASQRLLIQVVRPGRANGEYQAREHKRQEISSYRLLEHHI